MECPNCGMDGYSRDDYNAEWWHEDKWLERWICSYCGLYEDGEIYWLGEDAGQGRGYCAFCSAPTTSQYAEIAPPHEVFYCCDECLEHEKARFQPVQISDENTDKQGLEIAVSLDNRSNCVNPPLFYKISLVLSKFYLTKYAKSSLL